MPKVPSSTTFCGVLFCDDPTHEEAIRRVFKWFDYFIIKHTGEDTDDLVFDELEDSEIINTKKKDHWHFVIMFPYSVRKESIVNKLGVSENYIQKCSNRRSYLRYLTHSGFRSKLQYGLSDFNTNRPLVLANDLRGIKEPCEIKAEALNLIIQNKNSFTDYDVYIRFFFENGYDDELRRYPQVFRDLYMNLTGRPIYSFTRVRNDNTGEVFGI